MTALEFIASVVSSLAWPLAAVLAVWLLRSAISRVVTSFVTSESSNVNIKGAGVELGMSRSGPSMDDVLGRISDGVDELTAEASSGSHVGDGQIHPYGVDARRTMQDRIDLAIRDAVSSVVYARPGLKLVRQAEATLNDQALPFFDEYLSSATPAEEPARRAFSSLREVVENLLRLRGLLGADLSPEQGQEVTLLAEVTLQAGQVLTRVADRLLLGRAINDLAAQRAG